MRENNIFDAEDISSASSKESKPLFQFVSALARNWFWFVLCAIIGLFFAGLYLRYTIPTYRINAKLLVSDDKKGGSVSSGVALGELSNFVGVKSSVENEVEILKTSDLMREMVLEEKEYINFFKAGTVHDVPVLDAPYNVSLLSDPDSISKGLKCDFIKVSSSRLQLHTSDSIYNIQTGKSFLVDKVGEIRVDENPQYSGFDGNFGFSVIPVRDCVSSLSSSISVDVTNKNVSTIDLSLIHTLPKRGEILLTKLIDKYVQMNLHDKNVIADSTLAFISARLKKVTEDLSVVEENISGYKKRSGLTDISEQSRVLIENSAGYTKSVADVETKLVTINDLIEYLEDDSNIKVVPSSIYLQDASFNTIVAKYNDLVLERQRLLLANTETNPLVENLTFQIQGLRSDMIVNLRNTAQQLKVMRDKEVRLSNRINSEIVGVPEIERGFIDLTRLQQIRQAQYIFLQEKWDETAIARTANVSNSKVIDTAKAEKLSFAPKRKMVYALGVILGLIFPGLILYLKEVLNIKISGIEDIERVGGLTLLGAVSHSDGKEQVVVTTTSRSPIAEQFRALRTNLEFALNGGKIILFTSSMSGEGKSFVALNLAVSLALLDKKVLIMELDLRKPSITSKLDLAASKGFSHYVVRNDMQLKEIIMQSGAHENVDLIQAGAIPPNPAELLVHQRTQELIRELSKRYDYILMDAPPVGVVTDAQLLARYADCCLYLVRQGFTYKEQLRIPKDLVQQNKIRPIQLVVNDVQKKGGYYSGYGYGYGYGYGDYGQGGTHKKRWQFWKK